MSTTSTAPRYRHDPARDLDVAGACAALGLHGLTVRRYIADGSLYAYKLGAGRRWLVPAEAVRNFVEGESVPVDPLAGHVAAVVAGAPQLSPEQLDKLSGLLRAPDNR